MDVRVADSIAQITAHLRPSTPSPASMPSNKKVIAMMVMAMGRVSMSTCQCMVDQMNSMFLFIDRPFHIFPCGRLYGEASLERAKRIP